MVEKLKSDIEALELECASWRQSNDLKKAEIERLEKIIDIQRRQIALYQEIADRWKTASSNILDIMKSGVPR